MQWKTIIVAAALGLALAGCSSKGGVQGGGEGADAAATEGAGGPKINRYGQGGYGDGGAGAGYGEGSGGYGEGEGSGRYSRVGGGSSGSALTGDPELDNASGPLAKRVVYFMYDSDEVQPEYRSVVSAHAAYLAAHPDRTVVLEGHADERGSPEYNVGLSERRAQAVARMMQLQGAANGQIQVVSYGEEKPADVGHDESSWQQNRRVEIAYPGR
ncbi:peptidoglycan-associated lipoprotein [Methylomagnum ishizawai]|uniref:Peptidoglycan-associated lipoprotein n=1 Tax=Methylomagnum ishizawai TaxID=1760988 RepID=A0A1Y6DAX9_9GAMM|nr:peptidoglycan-associated lipoprotein Pal [Methylomagnum ishizawai]SMF96805.1 peptidoglycan-associated lipoprotein [Methylomagnum ishizawai]